MSYFYDYFCFKKYCKKETSVIESSDIVITILSQKDDYNVEQASNLKNNILQQTKAFNVSIQSFIF